MKEVPSLKLAYQLCLARDVTTPLGPEGALTLGWEPTASSAAAARTQAEPALAKREMVSPSAPKAVDNREGAAEVLIKVEDRRQAEAGLGRVRSSPIRVCGEDG
jgi:hypothetical protein